MNSSRNIIVAVIVLLAVAVGAYFLFASRTQAPKEAATSGQETGSTNQEGAGNQAGETPTGETREPSTITVGMNDDGFASTTIVARKGDSIVWANEGTKPHWPASAVHPTHEVYPELDPREAIAPGQSWTFIAGKVGQWRIHDHLNPSKTATIIIAE